MNRKILTLFPLGLFLAAGIGCSQPQSETFQVSGVVSCDGSTVPTGQVTFIPNGAGQPVSGAIGPNGDYELSAPAGDYKVIVIAIPEAPLQDVTKDNWIEAFSGKSREPYVPSYFGNADTSPIAYTVNASEQNTFDIPILSRAKKRSRR